MAPPVRCYCLIHCQKDGREFNWVSPQTRKRHEMEVQARPKPSSTLAAQTMTSIRTDKILVDTTSLLMDHVERSISKLHIKVTSSATSESKQIKLMPLRQALMVFTSLLHSSLGISRQLVNSISRFTNLIMIFANEIVHQNGDMALSNELAIPKDIRTINKILGIEPVLFQSMCCPDCFNQYDISDSIRVCNRKESPRSRPCGAELRDKENRPVLLYSTQSLIAWISGLLQMPGIEEAIDRQVKHSTPEGGYQNDVWDSPLWKDFKDQRDQPFFATAGNLGFSLFYDGFNPFGNKVSGKSEGSF